METSFFIKRAQQLLAECPSASDVLNHGWNNSYLVEKKQDDRPFDKRRETIVKTMLLIKEFHGTHSPLYRWLDLSFEDVLNCPVEKVLSLFLEHLDVFYSAEKTDE